MTQLQAQRDSILIIDDDEQVSDILSLVLEGAGYEAVVSLNPVSAFRELHQRSFALMLLDLRLGDMSGLDLLPRLRDLSPNTPIFMITAHGDVDSAVRAFSLGASGFIKKPFQDGDLKFQIAQAIESERLRQKTRVSRDSRQGVMVRDILLSRDPAMEPIARKVETAAQVSSNVVITGESGTGKEVVARALHRCGTRRGGPFVAFNCAALPEHLLESELFGYAKGAFTDARENKPGLFARAHGGTLFLDEIGDAPLSIQAKLLRVLQEREVLPLGSTSPLKIDVRIVAATHRNLQEEVARGRFRQDLYYRLHVIPIRIPALRDRPRDVSYLANVFAQRMAEEMKLIFDGFTQTAEHALESHDWPGNVRELQNRVEHALAISSGGFLSARSLFPESATLEEDGDECSHGPGLVVSDTVAQVQTFTEAKNSFEKSYLEQVLGMAKGNIAKAARIASKSRTEVYSLLRKHGLDAGAFKRTGTEGGESR